MARAKPPAGIRRSRRLRLLRGSIPGAGMLRAAAGKVRRAAVRLAGVATLTLLALVAMPSPVGPDRPLAAATAQKRVALVIGNSAYRYTRRLDNPRNDATDVGGALKRLGFQVIGGFDLDRAGLDEKIRDFTAHLRGASVGVFFYAGHGLHVAGQNNPTGVEPRTEHDTVAFTPYATIKDGFLLVVFCILLAWFVFYIPNFLCHSGNYIPANPAVTPTHIVPEWYYLPFYAILRAIPNKLLGVLALGASIVILAFLPWLDTSKVRSARYRPLYRQFFWAFVVVCIGLGWLGSKPPEGNYVLFARIFTIYYFAYFLVILPVLGKIERTKPVPNSIAESVLREGKPIGAPAPPPAKA